MIQILACNNYVHTLLKTDGGGSSNECSFKLLGDQNILTDNIFEIDKANHYKNRKKTI